MVRHERVTRERLVALIRWVESGEGSNGVGWAVDPLPAHPEGQRRSAGAKQAPGPNIEVGFEELKRLFVKYHSGALYNSGWLAAGLATTAEKGNRFDPIPQAYAKDVAAKARAW